MYGPIRLLLAVESEKADRDGAVRGNLSIALNVPGRESGAARPVWTAMTRGDDMADVARVSDSGAGRDRERRQAPGGFERGREQDVAHKIGRAHV